MYKVFIKRSAQKALSRIGNEQRDAIIKKIKGLEENPRPGQSKKLKGRDAYRLRIGRYRVIYEIEGEKLIVLVVAIGHRGDVYKNS